MSLFLTVLLLLCVFEGERKRERERNEHERWCALINVRICVERHVYRCTSVRVCESSNVTLWRASFYYHVDAWEIYRKDLNSICFTIEQNYTKAWYIWHSVPCLISKEWLLLDWDAGVTARWKMRLGGAFIGVGWEVVLAY